MYVGRDLLELSSIQTDVWSNQELHYYHEQMTQLAPYLNNEGVTIHQKIIHEMESRNQSHLSEASYMNGTKSTYKINY